MDNFKKLDIVKEDFKNCQKVLVAIGDETRQLIIMSLMDSCCEGMRVGEIKEKTHLSRPAVSHHLKILKDAEVIDVYKEGTKNFYYLQPKTKMMLLKKLMIDIEDLLSELDCE